MNIEPETKQENDDLIRQLFRSEPDLAESTSVQSKTDAAFLSAVQTKVNQRKARLRILQLLPYVLIVFIAVFAVLPFVPNIVSVLAAQMPESAISIIAEVSNNSLVKLGVILALVLGIPMLMEKISQS